MFSKDKANSPVFFCYTGLIFAVSSLTAYAKAHRFLFRGLTSEENGL